MFENSVKNDYRSGKEFTYRSNSANNNQPRSSSVQWLLYAGAIFLSVMLVVFDNSRNEIKDLQSTLQFYRSSNSSSLQEIASLKKDIFLLTHDKRRVELAARNTLSMANSDDIVIDFDDSSEPPR